MCQFILQMACPSYSASYHIVQTIYCINSMAKTAKLIEIDTTKVTLASYDGTWFTGFSGTTFATIPQILLVWCE